MPLPTAFAPAERVPVAVLQRQVDFVLKFSKETEFLDGVCALVILVNQQRQIVYANRAFRDFLGVCDRLEDIVGQRPGETLACVHACETPGGCGTSAACRNCGAAQAILDCQRHGQANTQECRLLRHVSVGQVEALDLRVSATPLRLDGESFSILTLIDISHEKRRQALERIFFHDILNCAGGLLGLSGVLSEMKAQDEQIRSISGLLHVTSEQLVDEIQSQRTLNAAERQELTATPGSLEALPFLKTLAQAYASHPVAQKRLIQVASEAQELCLQTDVTLLRRVLLNLLKNALEASDKGQTVTLDVRLVGGEVQFSVHNPAVIPDVVKNQIFKRSFSTRGLGRGVGTYSVKLLSERYLGGEVSFQSDPLLGTVFKVTLPMVWASSGVPQKRLGF